MTSLPPPFPTPAQMHRTHAAGGALLCTTALCVGAVAAPLRHVASRARPPEAPRLVLNSGPAGPVYSVKFSPDGRSLATASSNVIRLWDVESARLLRIIRHASSRIFAWSPDGRLLLGSHSPPGGMDRGLDVWEACTGRRLRTIGAEGGDAEAADWSPEGRIIASVHGGRAIELWDAASGRRLRRLNGSGPGMRAVAFSPDGKLLASGSGDEDARGSYDGALQLWDVASGKEVAHTPKRYVRSLQFTNQGAEVVTLSGPREPGVPAP